MITVRRAEERGHVNFGWLDTHHTFSFGDYYDPDALGFGSLRVINDDRVAPGGGFPTHPHRDMEIVTWVLSGAIEHKDSLGTGSVVRPGDLQRMTAGTGVTHSEFNHSRSEPLHLLQIWILPERRGLTPGYEQRTFPAAERQGRLKLLASRDGRDGSVTIHQDAALSGALLEPGTGVEHRPAPGRRTYVHLARGAVQLGSLKLRGGDGAAISNDAPLSFQATEPSELLLFDLA